MTTHKPLYTILYTLYAFLILITPTVFHEETVLANLIIKTLIILLPLSVTVLDGETYLSSISEIVDMFRGTKQTTVIRKVQEYGTKFPIQCLSVLKSFTFQFDPPQRLRKVSSRIVEIAEQHKLNLKPVRQQNGLRVNSFIFSVHDFDVENASGGTRKIIATEKALAKLSDELKRPLGGVHDVNYDLVPGSSNIQYTTAAARQNKAGLGNILRSAEYTKVIDKNRLGQVLNLPTALGVDLYGKPYTVDLKLGPHARLIGATGSGKSVAATTIITSLTCLLTPQELEIHIVDLKMVDYTLLNDSFPHVKTLALDVEAADTCLDGILKEMTRRYSFLKDAGAKSVREYNRRVSNKKDYIPQLLVLIDEYAELLDAHPNHDEINKKIIRITQMGRASGITVILGSQRLDSQVMKGGLIKTNTPAVFALKTSSNTDSQVALGHPGAEKLLGNGDCLLKFGDETTRIQFCMVSDDEVKRLGKMWKAYQKEQDHSN